ncbi:putative ATP-binding protein [Vibrio crassostreae]|nr:putative ATP-binding protein [Vibrio crassostreae]CAK2772419.1 putative ATP-binding protein [Vibrio crassostreae]CAK3219796.1 putative ATP-binding protein [Vibrio crassostreae]CAK3840383.1 putative ATP-binding protein [Vibrio crassostreae]
MQKKKVVVVSSGLKCYREYLFKELISEFRVWLISDQEASWENQYVEGVTVVPDYKPETIYQTALQISSKFDFDGLFSWNEQCVVATNDAAERLGLPAPGEAAIRACKDKSLGRIILSKNGVLQPHSKYCRTLKEATEFTNSAKFPLVVKPKAMGASIGVIKVSNQEELIDAFSFTMGLSVENEINDVAGVIVEEFIDGEEISIDGAVTNGKYEIVCIARKTVGLPPYFEEVAHTVSNCDPLYANRELFHLLQKAHSSIGFKCGVTHTEVKICDRGLVIIEINGRIGGDLISYIGSLVTDRKVGCIAARVAVGYMGNIGIIKQGVELHSKIEFIYPDFDMIYNDIEISNSYADFNGKLKFIKMRSSGDILRYPPNGFLPRAAALISVSNSYSETHEMIRHAKGFIRIDGEEFGA